MRTRPNRGQEIFSQPAVDSLDASRSRGVNHAFAEDCAVILVGQVQARRETIEPFPGVGAEGLQGLWVFLAITGLVLIRLLGQLCWIRTSRSHTSPSHPLGLPTGSTHPAAATVAKGMPLCSPYEKWPQSMCGDQGQDLCVNC